MSSRSDSRNLQVTCLVSNDLVHDQRMQRICDTLSAAGYQVTLVGRVKQGSPALKNTSYRQVRLSLLAEKGPLFYALLNLRLLLWMLWRKVGVIYAVDMDTMPAAVVAAKLKGAHLVYDAHEYYSESPELAHRPRMKSFWRSLESTLVRHADTCITVSNSLAEELEQRFSQPFILVRNLPQYYPLPDKGQHEQFILYQGALNTGRGLEALILAMKHIPMPLKLAGEGDLSTQLRELVKSEALQDKVQFLGWIPPDKLRQLTVSAWLGVNLLAPVGLSYKASLANKFFDYVMAGVPVLCTPFEEYIRADEQYHVSRWVAGLSPEAIAAEVNALLAEPEVYDTLRRNCLRAREELHWEREKQVLLTTIDRLA